VTLDQLHPVPQGANPQPAPDSPERGPATPIADYGLLGDTRTAALVSSEGSVDWLCTPVFDGEPVFGALLGGREAGRFLLGPVQPAEVIARRYRPHTATVETVWAAGDGRLTLTEAMIAEVTGQLLPTTILVRRLTAEQSPVRAVVDFDPRLGEQHRRPHVRRGTPLVCDWGPEAVSLGSSPSLDLQPGSPMTVLVTPGKPLTLVLALAHNEPLVHVNPEAAWDLVEADEARWQDWAAEVDPDIPFREEVVRSLLTLRLLTYSPSGAPVAAPTTSLPEDPGGIRNWDYRYSWPRDASIGVGTFLLAGKPREALNFFGWLLHASRLQRPRLPSMLTLTGRKVPAERSLDGWPGYGGSTPVRTGNGAASQHQLDGYGWVLDAAWVLVKSGHQLNSETWRTMRGYTDLVAARWQEPDAGIWEVRSEPAQHVHSKVMAWLAIDRALCIAATHRLGQRQRRRWQDARSLMSAQIREQGYSPERKSYTRTYGSLDLDAALLVLPVVGLEEPESSRLHGTIDAVRRELSAGFPFVYRYPPGKDGLAGTEGAFLPCSFWLAQALAAVGRVGEAGRLFTALLELGSPLGLYSEEIDPASGRLLGNYPQALTHAALVQAALALRDAQSTGTPR
jgi:GH15 family glucan-1,4-alpha-glucosidase